MGFLTTRVTAVSTYAAELVRHGIAEQVGPIEDEVLFVLDGVGGFQFAPLLIRRALRQESAAIGTVLYAWQFGLPGEIWTDLMWLRRNRVMGARLARRLLSFHRHHPQARIHLAAFSGGAGIGVFALETLGRRSVVETLLLPCPAISPTYNLGPALQNVARAYAWVSARDTGILGLGTRVFGTTDRQFTAAAGSLGFKRPPGLARGDANAYDRLWEVHWAPELKQLGHSGGHTGWVSVPFLRRHLLPMLHGHPLLQCRAVT